MVLFSACVTLAMFAPAASAQQLDFNRDIQPILSENCYFCHGPDKAQRKADLRLDKPAEATRDLGKGRRAIVAGQERRERDDPADAHDRSGREDAAAGLAPGGHAAADRDAEEVDRPGRGVGRSLVVHPAEAAGAAERAATRSGSRNPIDAFILARLEKEGCIPRPKRAGRS